MIELTPYRERVARENEVERIFFNPSHVISMRPYKSAIGHKGLAEVQLSTSGVFHVWESPADVAAMIDAALEV